MALSGLIRLSAVTAVALAALSLRAALTVSEGPDGTLSVLRDGRTFVRAVRFGRPDLATVEKSFETAADGSRVWNRWSSEKEGRFRLEVAQRADGAVELSLLGEADGTTTNRLRELWLDVPRETLSGKTYRLLVGSGDSAGNRKYSFAPKTGTIGPDSGELTTRWIETDGVLWDFNPLGVSADRTMGTVAVGGDGTVRFGRQFSMSGECGGHGAVKVILREGRYEDYWKHHCLLSFYYDQRLPSRLMSLGAPKTGADYEPGDRDFDGTCGWTDAPARRTVVGHPSGAYYSHVAGSGTATYRFAGLIDGYHVVTLQLGNYTGTPNGFSAEVNGSVLGTGISVGRRKARTISRAVRIVGGTADIRLKGDWIVSAVAVQPLLADSEDFQVRRGFWYAKGYEPASVYSSSHVLPPKPFPVADETIDMPVPGEEASAPWREPPRPQERLDREKPSLQWLRDVRMAWILENWSTMAEMDDPAWRKAYVGRIAEKGFNTAFVSGMLSRHTYPEEMARYGQDMVATLAREFHARGVRYVDHFDVTLLWNVVSGFRTMMERLPETLRARQDNLPSTHFCPNNPELKRKVFAYARRQVANGVDGFQLDEVEFWPHGCTCKWCRERFHRETGWWYPLDETDPSVRGEQTPLQKRWFAWRYQTVANWFVELRRHLKDLNPDVVFSMYNVHWNFMSSRFATMYSTDLLELGRVVDLMGTEVLVRNKIQMARPLVTLQRLFNVLNRLYGVPIYGIYYNWDMPRKYFCWGIGNMLGQSALLGDVWKDSKIPDFQRWAAGPDNMRRKGAEPVAEVALLFSRYSRDWNWTGYYALGDLFGLAQELEALSVPYEFIGDAHVNAADLARYKVLFLGVAQCLTDAEIAAVRAYAAKGGRVYLCEGSGTKDEFGERRAGDAFAGDLADPASNVRRMPSANDYHAWQRNNPQTWDFDPDPEKWAAFRQTVAQMVEGATFWRTEGLPPQVYTAVWKEADGATVMHFLNGTGAKESFAGTVPAASPCPAFPPLQEDIRLSLPVGPDARAVAVGPEFAGPRELPVRRHEDGWGEIVIPKDLFWGYLMVRVK